MRHEDIALEYDRNGFVHIPGFLSREDVGRIRQALDDYIRDVLPHVPEADRVLEADGTSVRNLWRMDQHDRFFKALAERAEITELVTRLVKGDPVLIAVETFNKPHKVGSAVPYHQDNAYFCQSPPDVLTVWVALDAANSTNGAIYYAPESHKGGLLPHKPSGVQGNSVGLAHPPDPVSTQERCVALAPGDALIHHCEVIHRSEPNRSDRPRCGLLMVYRGAHTRTNDKLRAWYEAAQPNKKASG